MAWSTDRPTRTHERYSKISITSCYDIARETRTHIAELIAPTTSAGAKLKQLAAAYEMLWKLHRSVCRIQLSGLQQLHL